MDSYFRKISAFKLDNVTISKLYDENIVGDKNNDIYLKNISYANLYVNENLEDNFLKKIDSEDDAYYFYYTYKYCRVVSLANGIAFTLPTKTIIRPYLQISNFRTQYETANYKLTVSLESSNTYNDFDIYYREWVVRYLIGDCKENEPKAKEFFKINHLSYIHDLVKSETLLDGYHVELFSILIEQNENIEKPYYNIAYIKSKSSKNDFILLVCKSKNDMYDDFVNIVKSIKTFEKFGTLRIRKPLELKIPEYWDEKTRKYYDLLLNQKYTGWGVFRYSMFDIPGRIEKIDNCNKIYENLFDYKFDIMPTYTHTGRYENDDGHFPLECAKALASGDGFNGKPVLQFTLQFTSNNNEGLYGYTPMFDILNGRYDNYFRMIAKEMKEYKYPILFRLNNEMNSDWVSYCGQVTLLDPDIFVMTYERMAKIFIEEGLTNLIFIFNPTGISYPFSSWGEDLCYLPSLDYVNVLGLTLYEYNNYDDNDHTKSFDLLYSFLYNKNMPQWQNYPAIISEFACGAGGETTGKLFRNNPSQAKYIKDCLNMLNNHREIPYINQIKGAVWFSCDDWSNDKIKNLLYIDPNNSQESIYEFKNGLAKTKKLKENN